MTHFRSRRVGRPAHPATVCNSAGGTIVLGVSDDVAESGALIGTEVAPDILRRAVYERTSEQASIVYQYRRVAGGEQVAVPDFPPAAVREALLNAHAQHLGVPEQRVVRQRIDLRRDGGIRYTYRLTASRSAIRRRISSAEARAARYCSSKLGTSSGRIAFRNSAGDAVE